MGRNGKSRALICFVLCMIMALPVYFSSAVAVKAAEQQTIIIGTNAEYSPFEYLDDNGNITGFDYDLLEAIAKEENDKALAAMQAAGTTEWHEMTADERAAFVEVLKPVHEQMAERIGADLIQAIYKETDFDPSKL